MPLKTKKLGTHAGILLAVAVPFFLGTATAASVPIGTADINGTVVVTSTSVSFFNTAATIAGIFDNGVGTGSFLGLTTPDSIMNLTGGPITGSILLVDFATFTTAAGLVHFDLKNIDPGTGTLAGCSSDAIGSSCTPLGSPFTLTQASANTVAFTFSIEGIVYQGTSASGSSSGQALFTGQRVPGTITGVLSTLAGGSFSNTYSATFSDVPTPEPSSLLMVLTGAGMLAAVSVLRRRRAGCPVTPSRTN